MDYIAVYYKFIDICSSIVEFKNISCILLLHYYYFNFDKLFEFSITEILWLLLIDFTLVVLTFIVIGIFYSMFDYIFTFRFFDISKLHQPQTMNIDDYNKLVETSIIGNNINKINLALLFLSNWRFIDIVKVVGEDVLLIGLFDEKFNQYKYLGLLVFVLMHTNCYESLIKLLFLGIKVSIISNSGYYHFINHNIYHLLIDILLLSLFSLMMSLNNNPNIFDNLVTIENIDKYITNILYFNTNISLYQDLTTHQKYMFPSLYHVLNIRDEILKKDHKNKH